MCSLLANLDPRTGTFTKLIEKESLENSNSNMNVNFKKNYIDKNLIKINK